MPTGDIEVLCDHFLAPLMLEALRSGLSRLPEVVEQVHHASSSLLREIAGDFDPLDLRHTLGTGSSHLRCPALM